MWRISTGDIIVIVVYFDLKYDTRHIIISINYTVYSAGKLNRFDIIKTKRINFFPAVLTMDFCHSTLERNTCQDPVFKCQIQFDLSLFSEWWNKDTLNNTF